MQKNILEGNYGFSVAQINEGKKLILEIVKRKPNPAIQTQTLTDSSSPVTGNPSTSSTNSTNTSKRIRFDDLELLFAQAHESTVSSLEQKFNKEWNSYMENDVLQNAGKFDRLLYWKNMKGLYELLSYAAQCILAIPASAAKCESDFSVAGKVKTKTRASISPKNLNAILTIRANADLIAE
jgi:hypothetical protein